MNKKKPLFYHSIGESRVFLVNRQGVAYRSRVDEKGDTYINNLHDKIMSSGCRATLPDIEIPHESFIDYERVKAICTPEEGLKILERSIEPRQYKP